MTRPRATGPHLRRARPPRRLDKAAGAPYCSACPRGPMTLAHRHMLTVLDESLAPVG
jgi:hypothetical protein